MSLSERVQRAAGGTVRQTRPDDKLLQSLREGVQELLSVDELALLTASNPRQARNELRSACRRVFDGSMWASIDEETRSNLVSQLVDAVFGFGAIEDLIADEGITEIIVNGPSKIFVEREGKLLPTDRSFASVSDLHARPSRQCRRCAHRSRGSLYHD